MKLTGKARKEGFTIMELLVAMTVFLIVIGISSGIFLRTIKTQRIVTDMSTSLNNITLALEQIAREARTGYAFVVEGDSDEILKFTNAQGEKIVYEYNNNPDDNGRGWIARQANEGDAQPITSAEVNISKLRFERRNEVGGKLMPTLITITLTTLGESDIEINLQTSVSSRIIGDHE